MYQSVEDVILERPSEACFALLRNGVNQELQKEKERYRKSQIPRLGIRVVKRRPMEHRPDFGWSVFGQRSLRRTRVARDRKTVAGVYLYVPSVRQRVGPQLF